MKSGVRPASLVLFFVTINDRFLFALYRIIGEFVSHSDSRVYIGYENKSISKPDFALSKFISVTLRTVTSFARWISSANFNNKRTVVGDYVNDDTEASMQYNSQKAYRSSLIR